MQGHAKASSQRKKDKKDQLIAENAALQQEAKRLGEFHIVTLGILEFKSHFLILEEVKRGLEATTMDYQYNVIPKKRAQLQKLKEKYGDLGQ